MGVCKEPDNSYKPFRQLAYGLGWYIKNVANPTVSLIRGGMEEVNAVVYLLEHKFLYLVGYSVETLQEMKAGVPRFDAEEIHTFFMKFVWGWIELIGVGGILLSQLVMVAIGSDVSILLSLPYLFSPLCFIAVAIIESVRGVARTRIVSVVLCTRVLQVLCVWNDLPNLVPIFEIGMLCTIMAVLLFDARDELGDTPPAEGTPERFDWLARRTHWVTPWGLLPIVLVMFIAWFYHLQFFLGLALIGGALRILYVAVRGGRFETVVTTDELGHRSTETFEVFPSVFGVKFLDSLAVGLIGQLRVGKAHRRAEGASRVPTPITEEDGKRRGLGTQSQTGNGDTSVETSRRGSPTSRRGGSKLRSEVGQVHSSKTGSSGSTGGGFISFLSGGTYRPPVTSAQAAAQSAGVPYTYPVQSSSSSTSSSGTNSGPIAAGLLQGMKAATSSQESGITKYEVGNYWCYTSTEMWHTILKDAALNGTLKGFIYDEVPPVVGVALVPKKKNGVPVTDAPQERYRKDADGRYYLVDDAGNRLRLAKFDIAYNPDKWTKTKGGYQADNGDVYRDSDDWAQRRSQTPQDYSKWMKNKGKKLMSDFEQWANDAPVIFGQTEDDKFDEYLDTIYGDTGDWGDEVDREDAYLLRDWAQGKESAGVPLTTWWKFWNYLRNKPADEYSIYTPPELVKLVDAWDEFGPLVTPEQVEQITQQPPKGNKKKSKGKDRILVASTETEEPHVQESRVLRASPESAVRTACTTVAHRSCFPLLDKIQGQEMHLGTLTWTPGKLSTLNHVTTNPHPVFLVQGPHGMERVRLSITDCAVGPQGERVNMWRVDKNLEEFLRARGYYPLNPKLCPDKGKCSVVHVRENGTFEGDGGEYVTDKNDTSFAEARYQSHGKYSGGPVVEGQLDENVYKGSKSLIGYHARGGSQGASNFFLRTSPEITRALQKQGKMRKACDGAKCTCTFEEIPDITLGPSEARLGAQFAMATTGPFRLTHPKQGGKRKQTKISGTSEGRTSSTTSSPQHGKQESQSNACIQPQVASATSPGSGAQDTGTQSQSSSAQ